MWKKRYLFLTQHPLIEFFHTYLLQEMEMRSSQPFPDYQFMWFLSDVFILKQRVIFASPFKAKWFQPYWGFFHLFVNFSGFFFSQRFEPPFLNLCLCNTFFETLWSMLHVIFQRRWHFRWICGNFLTVMAHWTIDVFYFLLFSPFIVN